MQAIDQAHLLDLEKFDPADMGLYFAWDFLVCFPLLFANFNDFQNANTVNQL